jgi:hypothetical protein
LPSNPLPICQQIVELSDNILIATLLSKNKMIDHYVRKKTPVPKQDRKPRMILQIHMLASIVKANEDYLGKVSYIHIKQEQADVLVFPLAKYIEFCVIVKRPFDIYELTAKISKALQEFNSGLVNNGIK